MKRHTLLAATLGALCLSANAAPDQRAEYLDLIAQEQLQDNVYKVRFPSMDMARRAAITLHEQLLESHLAEGYMIIMLSPDEKARIEGLGFTTERAEAWIRARNERLERMKLTPGLSLLGQGAGTESIPGFSCYETVEETATAVQGLLVQYPTLATSSVTGVSWQKQQGLGGYDMTVLKITNSQVPGPKPKLFIDSAIHAREYATAPLVLAFARQLLAGYGTDADATWILDHHEIHMLLQTNPDGRKKAETGLLWRKNTNTAYCSPTSNNRGADLNRNFTFTWNYTNGQGSSGNPCAEDFRGASAGSEPETQAVESYVRSLWIDRRGTDPDDAAPADTSGIHLDIHSYSQLVMWPWGIRAAPSGNGPAFQALGRRFAYFNGYTPQQAYGLYPTDGKTDSPSYGELGVAHFTFELGTAFFESCSSYQNATLPKNLPALVYAAKMVRTPYITAGGPDITQIALSNKAATKGVAAGTPVTLKASTTDLRFNNSNGTEPTQAITDAEVYIDVPPWLAGASAQALSAADGVFDAKTEKLTGVIGTGGLAKGKHLLFVRARDASNTWGPFSASFLVIK